MNNIRHRLYTLAVSISLLCPAIMPANAQNIPPEIEAILEAPRYKDAIWGLRVIDLETGQPLIDLKPRHKFFIGSVRKIFTVGELLNEVGPNHTFNTPV